MVFAALLCDLVALTLLAASFLAAARRDYAKACWLLLLAFGFHGSSVKWMEIHAKDADRVTEGASA
jgi:hypothetical protein